METDRLHQLRTISQTGSLTQAASLLGMTPGALSKSMSVLSGQLGFVLWHNEGRGLKLTNSAQSVVRQSLEILNSIDELCSPQLSHKASKQLLRIASFEVFTTRLLPELSKDISSETILNLYELMPGQIESALEDNKVDIGITYQPVPRAGIAYQKIVRIQMGVFGTKDFMGRGLKDLPFIVPLVEYSSMSRSKGLDGWDDVKLPREVKYRVAIMESGLHLAARKQGVIFIPKFVARLHNETQRSQYQLQEIDIKFPMKMGEQDVFIVTRQGDEDLFGVRKIAKLIRTMCK